MGIEGIFNFVVESSIIATILMLIILLIRLFLKGKLAPRIIYSFWIIVLLKFLIPYGPESTLSIYSILRNTSSIIYDERGSNDFLKENKVNNGLNESAITNNLKGNEINIEDKNLNKLDNKEKGIKTNEDVVNIKEKVGRIALISWGLVIFLLVTYGFFSYVKLKRIVKGYKEKERYKIILKEILISKKIKRKVKVIETDIVSSPAICGVFQGMILMPKDLGEKLSQEEIRYVFLHELTHFKNGDTIIAIIGALVKIIHWFNPFVYIGLKKMNEDCELACDYEVLKSLNKNESLKYGNTIINVIENINGNRQFLTATSMGKNKKEVKGRVRMIAGNKKFGRKSILIGVTIVAMISAIGLTSCSENKRSDKENIVDSKDNRGVISTPDKMVTSDKNLISSEEKTEIEKTLERYIRALNDGNLEAMKKEISRGFYDYKENEVAEMQYLDLDKLGEFKSIEIEEVISHSEVSVFVKCENSNKVFGLLKENNQWKIESLGFSPRNTAINKYEWNEKDGDIAREKLNSYIEKNNYKVQANSGVSGVIKLPKTFDEIKRDEKVGELIKELNDLSIKEGYDFTKYLGKEVFFEVMNLENDNGTIGVMVKDEKFIGCFMDKDLKSAELCKFMALME